MKLKLSIVLSFAILFLLFSCSGCSNKKKAKQVQEENQEFITQPSMEVNASDTSTVLQLSTAFLEKLKGKDIDGAISMLYYLKGGDSIVALPSDLAKKEKAALSSFPIYGFRIDYLKFYKETDSQVKYSLLIQDPKEVKNPAVIGGLFRPVRRNGQWYLTLADSKTDSVQSEIGRK